MLLLISEQRDAQILRHKVKTITQANNFLVLRDGRIFCINHTLDDSDNIGRIGGGAAGISEQVQTANYQG